jgi:uncharacterized protein
MPTDKYEQHHIILNLREEPHRPENWRDGEHRDFIYYTDRDRGAIPEYVNEFNLASWSGWLTFDAIKIADNLTKPVQIVHSEAAAIPQGAHQFYARLPEEKNELWLENITQFDFYDSPQAVNTASDAVAKYFQQAL